MSARASSLTGLGVADSGHCVHLLLDGLAVCGTYIDAVDVYPPSAGLAPWDQRPQCARCVGRLRVALGFPNSVVLDPRLSPARLRQLRAQNHERGRRIDAALAVTTGRQTVVRRSSTDTRR